MLLTTETHQLTLGCPVLDQAVGGGLNTGNLYDLCGEGGSGKTQLLLQLALRAQLPRELGGLGGGVVWINGHGQFPIQRFQELQQHLQENLKHLSSAPTSDQLSLRETHAQSDIQKLEAWIQNNDFLENVLIQKCTNLRTLVEQLLPRQVTPLLHFRLALSARTQEKRMMKSRGNIEGSIENSQADFHQSDAESPVDNSSSQSPDNDVKSPKPTLNGEPNAPFQKKRHFDDGPGESRAKVNEKLRPSRVRPIRLPSSTPPIRLIVIDSIAAICESSSNDSGIDKSEEASEDVGQNLTTLQRYELLSSFSAELKKLASLYGLLVVTSNHVSDVFESSLITPLPTNNQSSRNALAKYGKWSSWLSKRLTKGIPALRWCQFPFCIEREPAIGTGWGSQSGRMAKTLRFATHEVKKEVSQRSSSERMNDYAVCGDENYPLDDSVENESSMMVGVGVLSPSFVKPKLGMTWTMCVNARIFLTKTRRKANTGVSMTNACDFDSASDDHYIGDKSEENETYLLKQTDASRSSARLKLEGSTIVSDKNKPYQSSVIVEDPISTCPARCLRLEPLQTLENRENEQDYSDQYCRSLTVQFASDLAPCSVKFAILPSGLLGLKGSFFPRPEEI